jgi:purine-binding chemotaxis protein CheW
MSNDPTEEARAAAPPPADEGEGQESDLRQFVTFITGDEVFAVDMTPVQEIIRVPEMVRVPLAPASLDGLANLRGKVLPIISLRRIFGLAERAADDATRALVIDLGQPLGFVVDRVSSVIGVDPARIEDVGALRATVNTELLSGLIKDAGGHAMIMVLNFARLIETEFSAIAAMAKAERAELVAAGDAAVEADDEDGSDELQLVSFDVAGQEYAIAIEDVQEIVQAPDDIVHVPRSAAHVIGVMMLRNRLLPLASLRCLFGLPARATDERSRIVVVGVGNASVGLVMDSVNEVLRVGRDEVDAMPPLLQRDGDLSDITSICRLDGGKRLVSIISAAALFSHSAIKEALTTVDKGEQKAAGETVGDEGDEGNGDDDEQVVIFRLDKEEFGAPIDSVQEIVRVPETLTHVPKAPPFVEGVINLRGTVLPVIDLRRRLGLPAVPRSDRQRVIVFLLGGIRTGFIVDSVAEVLKIPKASIEAAPRLSSEQARLLARMANLEREKRMVQLIEPARLIDGGDLDELAALAA